MNKSDLIRQVAAQTGLTLKQAKAAVEALVHGVGAALENGFEVQFKGFGTFKTVQRQARKGINPATNQQIIIPAKSVVVFRAGKELKKAVDFPF